MAWARGERGARRAAQQGTLDQTPVPQGPEVDERRRPVPVRRHSVSVHGARDVRVDPTRVSGPIRVVLEPLVWVAFLAGVIWLLIAVDPGLRASESEPIVFRWTMPLAIVIGLLLVVSSVTALMGVSGSTSATRARTSFAGMGLMASGWLFSKLHPIDNQEFLGMSWLCIAVGILLVTICFVPWPTAPAVRPGRRGPLAKLVIAVLCVAILVLVVFTWKAARLGLVGVRPEATTGWDHLLPLLGTLVILLAAVRWMIRRPGRRLDSAADVDHFEQGASLY